MAKYPVALVIALTLAISVACSGCDSTSKITEQEHIQRAKDFESKDDLKSSILELKNAIQKNPSSAQARLLLGQIYVKSHDGQSAEKELRRAWELGVSPEMLVPLLGDALLLQKEYKKILDEIEATERSSNANRAKITRIRADALFGLRQYKDACEVYTRALELDDQHAPTYWGLANCAYGKRDTALAQSWLEKAVQLNSGNADSWIRLGDFHRLQKAYAKAEVAFTNAVKTAPKNANTYINRAGTRLMLNNEKGATEDFEAAQAIAPNDPLVKYMQALFDYRAGKLEPARDKLETVNRAMPGHFQTNLLLGYISYRLGNLQSAETYLSRILNIAPASEDVRLTLASIQMRLGQPQKALEVMQPLLTEAQSNSQVLAQMGDIYMDLQQFSLAKSYYTRAIEADQQSTALQTKLARSHLALGQTDSAISELKQVVRLETKATSADTLLIMAQLRQGKFDQALADINVLEKKLPASPLPSYLRGQAYLGKNDSIRAEAEFRQALELQALFSPAAESLADLKVRQGKPAEAAKVLTHLLERNPKSLEAMLGMAELARLANRPDESLEWLNKAVKTEPTAISPRQRLVAYYLAAHETNKALVVANESVAKNTNDVNALYLLAQVHLAQRNFDSAVATFTRITALQPRMPAAHVQLANAQMGAGKHTAARETLQRALALSPASLDIKAALISVEVAEGKLDAALKRAQELQAVYPNEAAGYILAGDLLMNKSRYAEAAAMYEKAYTLAKSGPVAISRYRALRSAGKDDLAISALANWVTHTPSDDNSRLYLATAYRNAGRMQDALRQFNYLLSKDAKNAMVLNEMAITYQSQKDPLALSFAERAYKLRPVPAIADTLAMILLEKGDKQRALELLENAVKAGTTNPEIRYHHAVALAQNGQNVKAKQRLQELLAAKKPFQQEADARALLARLK